MLRIMRIAKILLLVVVQCAIISNIAEIYAVHVRRITPFAEVVQSSLQEIQNTITGLGKIDAANAVVEAFDGVFEKEFTSADARNKLVAERQISDRIAEHAADYRYSLYRLPYIADYCGMLLIRSSSDGRFLDYAIIYDGGEND